MGDTGTDKEILTFDQLLRQRAVDVDQTPLLAYPRSRLGVNDYELVTGAKLNRFVDGAAKALLQRGFKPVVEETVVGIYAPSDLHYIITIFGLGRLGYTAFMLSPRLPASAVATLLTACNTSTLFYGDANAPFAQSVRKLLPILTSFPILNRDEYDSPAHEHSPPFERQNLDPVKEHYRKYLMLHSSGSTGLPKPISFSNKRLMVTFLTAQPHTAFQSVPFSHAHGLVTYVQHIYTRKTLYLMNGLVPQTHDTVSAAIDAANPEIVWTVPYVLKLLAEKQDGIDVLKRCKMVSSSGSRCPDDLGDLLVSQGVFLGLTFGATEVASLFSSLDRPRDDMAWNYMRPQPHVKPHLLMQPVDGEICEAVVLDGHKSKAISNSDDPPNSYHTSDLFVPHPVIPDAWKFVGRLDDRITLLNGEKVLPLPIEGRIRRHPFVKEAVMFGVDKPVPGLLLFRSENAAHLNDEEFLDEVWPIIHEANTQAEGFSQISKDVVLVVVSEVDCASTDKSSIKRAQIYRDFASAIEDVYHRLEFSQGGLLLQLSQQELEVWILEKFQQLDINIPNTAADFFTSGVDSLKAIQMRGLIVKHLDMGANICGSMIVYDCGNTKKLAEKLYQLRVGETAMDWDEKEIETMKLLIDKYSTFQTRHPEGTGSSKLPKQDSSVFVLTGATGSLGSHILAQLAGNANVQKIFCLVRSSHKESATERLVSALKGRNLLIPLTKVISLSCELSNPNFGLTASDLARLQSETTHIIHCAWAVNFALSVQSFEPQIEALHNLLSLSLSTPEPASLLFCSSIGTAMATPRPAYIASTRIPELCHASPTGYSRSKLIGERILEAAVFNSGAHATILRIGQIVPARNVGSQLWNPNEAVPLMIQSAVTLGVLPEMPNANGADECTWIEADVLAKSVLELARLGSENDLQSGTVSMVYNLVNPKPFSWKRDLLPALKAAGLDFEVVPWKMWLQKLDAEEDVEKNFSRKLLGFWKGRKDEKDTNIGEIIFETKEAVAASKELKNAERTVDGEMVGSLLEAWSKVWGS